MSILFGCNSEESNERDGLKAALNSRDRLHTGTNYTRLGTRTGGGRQKHGIQY